MLLSKRVFGRATKSAAMLLAANLWVTSSAWSQGYSRVDPHFRVTGIVFSSPNGSDVTVPLPEEDVEKMEAGYSLRVTIRLASIPQSNRVGSRKWRFCNSRRYQLPKCSTMMVRSRGGDWHWWKGARSELFGSMDNRCWRISVPCC